MSRNRVLLDIQEEWPEAAFDVRETEEELVIDTGAVRFVARKRPWQYVIVDRAGKTLLAEHVRDLDAHFSYRSLPLGYTAESEAVRSCNETFAWTPGEAIYGFGEKFTRLNKVGQTIAAGTRTRSVRAPKRPTRTSPSS